MQKARRQNSRTKKNINKRPAAPLPLGKGQDIPQDTEKAKPRQYPITPVPPLLRLTAFLIDASVLYVLIIVTKFLSVVFSVEALVWHPEAAAQDILIIVGYFVIPTAFWGRTAGKWALGMVVVDETGYLLGPVIAIPREIAFKVIASSLLLVGIAWIAIDPKRQGMHDKLANTYVVYNPDSRLASILMSISGVKEAQAKQADLRKNG